MKLMKKDIKPNDNVTTFFALESMKLRKSKNQKNFLELVLQDRTGKIKGYLWDNPVIAKRWTNVLNISFGLLKMYWLASM